MGKREFPKARFVTLLAFGIGIVVCGILVIIDFPKPLIATGILLDILGAVALAIPDLPFLHSKFYSSTLELVNSVINSENHVHEYDDYRGNVLEVLNKEDDDINAFTDEYEVSDITIGSPKSVSVETNIGMIKWTDISMSTQEQLDRNPTRVPTQYFNGDFSKHLTRRISELESRMRRGGIGILVLGFTFQLLSTVTPLYVMRVIRFLQDYRYGLWFKYLI
ncbi:hypothetical protein [Haladaptatus sp. CMAA 1911]|uniref:hypothetical protein n=1 Tax=unclassified Haladaptatus TaxID=2622732 RepID=UPI0037549D26